MSTETTEVSGDDLRSTITAAFETKEEEIEAPAEGLSDSGDTEKPEEQTEKPARERDERGKFKAKEKEAPETVEQKVSDQTPEAARIAPPKEWSGHAKVRWEGLPRAVQEALIKDYEQISEQRTRTSSLEQILEPRRNLLAANYGSLEQGVNYLFQVSDFAEKDPNGFIQWFAQQRGIPLSNLAPGTDQPEGNPLQAALNEIQTLKRELQGLQTNIQSQNTHSLQSQIDAFASDPAHPYFNDVRIQMSGLMQSGAAKTLDDAYQMACWASPQIRAELQKQEFEKQEKERKQKAEQAKRAAGSIGGSPEGGITPGDEPASTLREELIRNMKGSRV